jgi:ABC-2 type transport system permease protein
VAVAGIDLRVRAREIFGFLGSFAPLIFTATLPILLLSGVLLPLTLAPTWLRAIAAANTLAYAVDAARALFNNHLADPSVPNARQFGRAIA